MKFALLTASAVLAVSISFAPVVGEAQQVLRIGLLQAQAAPPPGVSIPAVDGFRGRLRELGYVEGKDFSLEPRWADGNYDRLPDLAADLVRARVDVILAIGAKTAEVALDATSSIPIVAVTCERFTVIESLARHGRNLTGVTCMTTEMVPKRLELFKEAVPKAARIAFLYNPLDGEAGLQAAKATASTLKLSLIPVPVRSASDFETALESVRQEHPDGLFVHPDVLIFRQRARIAEFALKHRLPSIDPFREFVDAGGLMSYGVSLIDMSRRAAEQADRIFKGAKAADLPIEQSTRFYLTINLKTAKTPGLTIAPSILLRTDQLIE